MTVDKLITRVKALVAAGEYLDDLAGRAVRSPDEGGWFRQGHDGTYRRMYQRGSSEYVEAKQRGMIEPLPALPLATMTEVEEAEDLLGTSLPPLLRRLYLEVGNGGFGPGYGLLGLRQGHRDDTGRNAMDLYKIRRQQWPGASPALLPICHWGCAIYSFVDCSTEDGDMWAYDPNPPPHEELDQALFPQHIPLAEWLERWINGQLFQPCLTRDEITGRWRGATDEELAGWTTGE